LTFQTLEPVHATHDIQQGPNLVRLGCHGTVVRSWDNCSSTTYSVEFVTEDEHGAVLTMSDLTESDVEPD